jgi:hypothetical protein
MLATQCACCGLPLVDAKSVETGVGPDCRKKHGFDLDVPESVRSEANVIVHAIAMQQDGAEVIELCARLHSLGFVKLASRVGKRVGCVRIEEDGDQLVVRAPFNGDHVNAMRRVPGRRWDREAKADRVPVTSKPALWSALCSVWSGKLGVGPRGMFVIGSKSAA